MRWLREFCSHKIQWNGNVLKRRFYALYTYAPPGIGQGCIIEYKTWGATRITWMGANTDLSESLVRIQIDKQMRQRQKHRTDTWPHKTSLSLGNGDVVGDGDVVAFWVECPIGSGSTTIWPKTSIRLFVYLGPLTVPLVRFMFWLQHSHHDRLGAINKMRQMWRTYRSINSLGSIAGACIRLSNAPLVATTITAFLKVSFQVIPS